ncbi:MAG: ABC transporter ATP-binding protein [Burkholderiaceae bacterium]
MISISIDEKRFKSVDGGELFAIQNLKFDVETTEFVCLVGPSGCGKTTTLRILLGLDNDFSGAIDKPDGFSRISAVFQEPRLLPWRTVEQNVRLVLPKEERSQDLDSLFEPLGLQDVRRLYPRELSLGLARRVAIARAYAFSPSLLILDEPFVSLDENTARRLRASLVSVWQSRPTAVVMVTHNMHEAFELADRIIMLSARPATIRGEYKLDCPREERTDQWIATEIAAIEERFP